MSNLSGLRLLIFLFTALGITFAAQAGDGCDAVDEAADAAKQQYTEEWTGRVISTSYTPADDLGSQSCLADILSLNIGMWISLPDIIIQQIIDAVINAACTQITDMVLNTVNTIYAELAGVDLPYGLGRAAFGLTARPGVEITPNTWQPDIPQVLPSTLVPQ